LASGLGRRPERELLRSLPRGTHGAAARSSGVVIQLESKRKAHVLARLRTGAAPVAALWARQGLVADAESEVSAIAGRVAGSTAFWELARERSFTAGLLGSLLGI